jgi:hypothetical protein
MVAVKQQPAVPGLVVLQLSGGNAKCQQLRGAADIIRLAADSSGLNGNLKSSKASMLRTYELLCRAAACTCFCHRSKCSVAFFQLLLCLQALETPIGCLHALQQRYTPAACPTSCPQQQRQGQPDSTSASPCHRSRQEGNDKKI